jgi:hypothetical protein
MKKKFIIGLLAVSLFSSCGSNESKNHSGEIIATFEYVELGDYYHLIFKDDKGEEWDFGYGQSQNSLGSFDFGNEQSNPDLVGKKFKIVWENKKVNSYDLQGKDYTMDALCIVKIELIK